MPGAKVAHQRSGPDTGKPNRSTKEINMNIFSRWLTLCTLALAATLDLHLAPPGQTGNEPP